MAQSSGLHNLLFVGRLSARITAWRWLFVDRIRISLTGPLAELLAFTSDLFFTLGLQTLGTRSLFAASRLGNSAFASRIRRQWDAIAASIPQLVSHGVTKRGAIERGIVLREPDQAADPRWKGILVIKFTKVFSFYFREIDIERLTNDYHVILEPSWMGYCDPDILFWTRVQNVVFVEAAERRDRDLLNALGRNLVPIAIGSGDWVDDRVFRPLDGYEARKLYDVAYVSNRGMYKRAHVFFRAVKEASASRRDFQAAYVCSSWGGKHDDIRDLIRYYGVAANVRLFEDLDQTQVNEVLNCSKSCVLVSRKEGSNRSLFESMFADTPVILLQENVGVNHEHINEETGLRIRERELAPTMLWMADNFGQFSPRRWASQHISPHASRQKIVSAIRSRFAAEEIEESAVRVKVNSPELRYYDQDLAACRTVLMESLLNKYTRKCGPEQSRKLLA